MSHVDDQKSAGFRRAVFRRALLAWYDTNRRRMPWRDDPSPYRVVLSEFMLQQTQVETVIPYYQRFVERFPTIQDLAAAPLDDVLKMWEGLGYYSRARNLHAAATEIVIRHDGTVPASYEALASLRGFGPYTTAAVMSIAFSAPYAVVDGNVIRVMARLFGIRSEVTCTESRRLIAEHAAHLLDPKRPGDYNQALMDLGATICSPKTPDCAACPVATHCLARREGVQDKLPKKAKARTRPTRTEIAVVLRREDELLVAQRPTSGLLGGLWEFPSVPLKTENRRTWNDALSARTGLHISVGSRLEVLHHTFTHFELELRAHEGDWKGGTLFPSGYARLQWVPLEALGDLAFSRVHRRLVDFISHTHQLVLTV